MLKHLKAARLVAALAVAATLGRAGDANAACATTNLTYGGGSLITNPTVYVVYWQMSSDPYSVIPVIEGYLRGIGGTEWLNTLTQYSVAGQTISFSPDLLGPEWYDFTDPYDGDYATEAANAAAHFGVTGDPNAIILILDENATCDTGSSYHNYVTTSGGSVPYIRLRYYAGGSGCFQAPYMATVLHHELSEAVTDPFFNGWLDSSGCEVVDKCSPFNWAALASPSALPLNQSMFQLPQVWSNEASHGAGSCVAGYITTQRQFYTGSNGVLYCRDGGLGWFAMADPFSSSASAPGAASFETYSMDAFVRNAANGIDRVHTSTTCGNFGWSQWGAPSGRTPIGRPDAASWAPERLDVVTLTQPSGGGSAAIYHRFVDNGTLSAWKSWGNPPSGALSNSPAIVAPATMELQSGDFALHVFAIDDSGVAWHATSTDGVNLGAWESLPNPPVVTISGNPDAGSWGAVTEQHRIDMVAAGSDGAVWRLECKSMTNQTCASGTVDWVSLGHPSGITLTAPSSVAMGDYRMSVVAKGSDGNFYQQLVDTGTGSWSKIAIGPVSSVGRAEVAAYR